MQNFLFKRRGFLAYVASLLFLVVAYQGAKRAVDYTLPLFIGDPVAAAEAKSGDSALAYYDAAFEHYQARDYEGAIKLASLSYSALTAEKGSIAQTERVQKMAGDVQFLLGLCRERNKQTSQAVDAYEQALRHNPSHMPAKYNLERLLKPSGGGGGGGTGNGAGDGDGNKPGQQPGGGASHQGKKGI